MLELAETILLSNQLKNCAYAMNYYIPQLCVVCWSKTFQDIEASVDGIGLEIGANIYKTFH